MLVIGAVLSAGPPGASQAAVRGALPAITADQVHLGGNHGTPCRALTVGLKTSEEREKEKGREREEGGSISGGTALAKSVLALMWCNANGCVPSPTQGCSGQRGAV